MRILSYNVNGIRSALSKGLADWIKSNPADIICLQETKAQEDQVDLSELYELGYQAFWHSAEKKGYSGVCTLSKIQPDLVVSGCGIDAYDREGRILRTDFGDLTLLNCYFPSGTSGEERQAFKMVFLDDFYTWAKGLNNERSKLLIAGDYNIAHTENDIHDPKGNKNSSGFLPEERAWMSKWFENGFIDTFRKIHPDKTEYSWWSFRAAARSRNKGWRIDYITASRACEHLIQDAGHFNEAVHSDHCPVFLDIK
jgi:exodeoxyribonuclease III